MDHTLPPGPGVPPMSSREQARQPTNQVSQGQSSTPPSATPQNLYPPPHQDVPGSQSRPTAPPSAFNISLPPYSSSPPLFRHRTNYADTNTQYMLSHSHPPSRMVYSSPPFAFPHHPGVPGREARMPHLVYSSPSIMSMLHQHQPVYAYQGPSTDPTPSRHQSYVSGTTTTALPFFPQPPVSPHPSSRSSLTPPPTSTASGDVPRPASYSSTGSYSPVGYTTPPPFVYPPPFVPPISLYGSHYPALHYTQSYSGPPRPGDQGARWYFSPDATSANLDHRSLASRHEDERPGQIMIVTPPHNPSPTGTSPSQSRFGGPSDPRTETAPTSLTTPSTSTSQTKTAENPPASEGWRDWHQERRSYHPKSPAQRSEWVMWAGNVPSDATPDELRNFFNQSLPPPSPSLSEPSMNLQQVYGGVLSVFLIARSNCAFVNFESEAQLEAATARFHGQPIRPDDSQCPRLVCRVRNRTDDLKAGVGAQRGNAMHIKWIKEQRERTMEGDEGANVLGLPDAIQKSSTPLSLSDDDDQERSPTSCSSRSDSFASTNSSILARYFPQRYFILKSRSQSDLDLSIERNAWATQQHNEEILDQAYRTSKDVFLVFGVNKSGEFYGYARMAGPILQSEDRVHWASHSTSPALLGRSRDVKGKTHISPPPETAQGYDPHYIFPPEEHRVVEQSPRSVSDTQEGTGASSMKIHASSAPAELRVSHHRPAQDAGTGPPTASFPPKALSFELNTDAPYRAMRETPDQSSRQVAQSTVITAPSRAREEISEGTLDAGLQTVAEEPSKENVVPDDEDVWGRPFRVDWIRTERLPFFRTRHLRNPWNHGREVKVSRDGTELEPSIGRHLLEEWDKPPPSPTDTPAPLPRTGARRRGPKSTHT